MDNYFRPEAFSQAPRAKLDERFHHSRFSSPGYRRDKPGERRWRERQSIDDLFGPGGCGIEDELAPDRERLRKIGRECVLVHAGIDLQIDATSLILIQRRVSFCPIDRRGLFSRPANGDQTLPSILDLRRELKVDCVGD